MTTLNFKARVPVFDANVRVGDRPEEVSPCRNRNDLLAEMDRHGVERALIYHAQGEHRSPIDGNEDLEEWIGNDERLQPLWSVLSSDPSLAQIKDLHAKGRVNCARLHIHDTIHQLGLIFKPWAYDILLSWFSDNHIPLWIPLLETENEDIVSTLQDYPNLVTVIVGAHYRHSLWVRPAMKALPNAYLELSRYEPLGEIEALRNEFGVERLVYGSYYSRFIMGPMLFYLHHTNLSDDELKLVCSGNLKRILANAGKS